VDERLSTAFTALGMGMGVVFVGLTLLQWAMYFSTWAFTRKSGAALAPAEGVAPPLQEGTVIQPSGEGPRLRQADGGSVSAETAAAVALALHLDEHAHREQEARLLTWTEMIRPFSPWVMDGKTSLHTRRLRWRANAAPGRILRAPRQGM
jgi:Na+-transporting methylmalonyl-CoA/oxaloacetate decarboxylase gamma subunit